MDTSTPDAIDASIAGLQQQIEQLKRKREGLVAEGCQWKKGDICLTENGSIVAMLGAREGVFNKLEGAPPFIIEWTVLRGGCGHKHHHGDRPNTQYHTDDLGSTRNSAFFTDEAHKESVAPIVGPMSLQTGKVLGSLESFLDCLIFHESAGD